MDAENKKDAPARDESTNAGTVKLSVPYTTPAGEKLTEVTVRPRLTVHDLREIQRRTEKPEDYEVNGVAVLCNMPADDLLDMDARDYMPLRDRFFELVGIKDGISRG